MKIGAGQAYLKVKEEAPHPEKKMGTQFRYTIKHHREGRRG